MGQVKSKDFLLCCNDNRLPSQEALMNTGRMQYTSSYSNSVDLDSFKDIESKNIHNVPFESVLEFEESVTEFNPQLYDKENSYRFNKVSCPDPQFQKATKMRGNYISRMDKTKPNESNILSQSSSINIKIAKSMQRTTSQPKPARFIHNKTLGKGRCNQPSIRCNSTTQSPRHSFRSFDKSGDLHCLLELAEQRIQADFNRNSLSKLEESSIQPVLQPENTYETFKFFDSSEDMQSFYTTKKISSNTAPVSRNKNLQFRKKY